MSAGFDIVVIGAGHNGLTAAGYLARAGKRVCVLEARPVVGGAAVTEELIPGARFPSCSFVQGMLRPEIIEDLELAHFGLQSTAPEVQGLALWENGAHVMSFTDVDRTLASITRHDPASAKGFFDFATRLKRFSDIARDWLLAEPPLRSEVFARFEALGESDLLDEFLLLSADDLLRRHIPDDRLRGYMMFLGMVSIWGGPSTPQTSWVYGYHSFGEFEGVFGRWALPKGGMGAISAALRASAEHHGAVVRTSAPVRRILMRGGRAAGVELVGGEVIEAGTVISNAEPGRTLGTLLPPGTLSPALEADVAARDHRGSMARIHLLIEEPPDWIGLPPGPGAHHGAHAILNATPALFEAAAEAQRRGLFPEDFVIEALIPSWRDPSLVDKPGRHTLVLGVQQLPFSLASGTWDDHRDVWTTRVLETLFRFAPNLRGKILGSHTITPLDLERTYGLTGGNIFQGSMLGLEHNFAARTTPGGSGYRSAIPGLYFCGAGVHPGGGVTGAPGHNAAHRVLADLDSTLAWPAARAPSAGATGLIDRMLATERGRSLAWHVARSRAARGITQFFTKVRK